MIPSNLIKTINGEPCIEGRFSFNGGMIINVGLNNSEVLLKKNLPKNAYKDGDKVWVKCYELEHSDWGPTIYNICLDANGKATIYPVEQEPEVNQEEFAINFLVDVVIKYGMEYTISGWHQPRGKNPKEYFTNKQLMEFYKRDIELEKLTRKTTAQ